MQSVKNTKTHILAFAQRGAGTFAIRKTLFNPVVALLKELLENEPNLLTLPFSEFRNIREETCGDFTQNTFVYSDVYAELKKHIQQEKLHPKCIKLLNNLDSLLKSSTRSALAFGHQFDTVFNPTYSLQDLLRICSRKAELHYVTLRANTASIELPQQNNLVLFVLHSTKPFFVNGVKCKPTAGKTLVLSGAQLTAYSSDTKLLIPPKKQEELIIERPIIRFPELKKESAELLVFSIKM